jgi:putative oxidoreductase
MSFALFILRALLGALFVGHGAQKVLGKFGGYGPEGTGQFFESLGLRPGKPMALAAGGTEMGGGALLAAGLATPLAAAGLTSVMSTAAWTVHRPNGPWIDKGGYEYTGVITAALLAIVAEGPGRLSLDSLRGHERWGLGVGLAALAAGIGASAAVIASAQGDGSQPAPAGTEVREAPAGAASAA